MKLTNIFIKTNLNVKQVAFKSEWKENKTFNEYEI